MAHGCWPSASNVSMWVKPRSRARAAAVSTACPLPRFSVCARISAFAYPRAQSASSALVPSVLPSITTMSSWPVPASPRTTSITLRPVLYVGTTMTGVWEDGDFRASEN